MRRMCGVLTALVLSGAIFGAAAETRTAEEKADVALVEREIRAVGDAIAIHNRAKARAEKAVALSSLGQELRTAKAGASKAWQDLKASRAHREYLGKDKITDRRSFAKSIGEEGTDPYVDWLSEKYRNEIDRRRKRYSEAAKVPKLLSEQAALYAEQVSLFVKKMTRIFLTDEIERAQQKKLDGLMRELKKIRKKGYAHI